MICTTCNLHYPEHLNFCRRCGNTLTESMDEPAIEAPCCTRCGSRFILGENFCQQCGYKLSQRSQETVVGGCYGCGTPWRSGWLYCRKCGLDRDQALIGPVSASADGVLKVSPPGVPETPIEVEIEQVPCPVCGVEIKPYSRFCEACGGSISPFSRPISPSIAETGVQLSNDGLRVAGEIQRARVTEIDQLGEPEQVLGVSRALVDDEYDGGVKEAAPQSVEPSRRRDATGEGSVSLTSAASTRRDETEGRRISGMRRSGPIVREEKGVLANRLERTAEESRSSGNAAWQTFGIVSVVLIILGLLASWWVLRAEPLKSKSGNELESTRPAAVKTGTAVGNSATVPVPPAGMAYVPGGLLRMGRENGDVLERPTREVTVAPFFMDVTEVTNETYLRYVRATGVKPPSHWVQEGSSSLYREGEALFPVVNVSWDEAQAFAEWAGKRLPRESEWEMAARGLDGRIYPWGDTWKKGLSNVGEAKDGHLMRVGTFPLGASQFGILDLSGNAWEWTADKPMRYGDDGVLIAEGRVIRGGAYDVGIDQATGTYRGIVPANTGYHKTGFRCVRDIR